MINSNPSKPDPNAAIIVFGRQDADGLPQAAWFRKEDRKAAEASAAEVKFAVIALTSDAGRALAVGVHEGVLKGSGRMIVGAVEPEVHRRIEEHVAKVPPAPTDTASSDKAAGAKPTTEQNKKYIRCYSEAESLPAPSAGKRDLPPIPARDPWDALRVGDHVVAKYWETDGTPYGWWVGVIVEIVSDGVFVIRWPDEHKTPPLKIERKHVAILHPSYDVNTEWQRRR
jgi:hypothetical protein